MNNTFHEIEVKHKGGGSLLPLLEEAQRRYGYLPEEVMIELAKSLDIPVGEVYGVVSF